ncbi:MAG: hypothetical protein V2B18_00430 [Pseudomonadota bacterium]
MMATFEQAREATVSRWSRIIIRCHKWTLLGPVMVLLLLAHGLGAERPDPSAWQPDQMWSKVNYDPSLTDPFFDTEEWRCRDGCTACATCRDGKPVEKNTAKCYSTSFGVKHQVRFCLAKSNGPRKTVLFIDKKDREFLEDLTIIVEEGWFRCQYRAVYKTSAFPHANLIWTTKSQRLTLDREEYHRGDVIKGWLEFECLEEPTHPIYLEKKGRHLRTIKVYGVFKTIVK